MKAEDLIKKLKEQPSVDPEQLKRSRRIALVLAASTIVSILFLIYGFLQRLEADKQFKLAVQYKMELIQAKEEAEKMKLIAEAAKAEVQEQRDLAEQRLIECEKSKAIRNK